MTTGEPFNNFRVLLEFTGVSLIIIISALYNDDFKKLITLPYFLHSFESGRDLLKLVKKT